MPDHTTQGKHGVAATGAAAGSGALGALDHRRHRGHLFSANYRELPKGRQISIAGRNAVRITADHVGLADVLNQSQVTDRE
jgi:hypothetical protein